MSDTLLRGTTVLKGRPSKQYGEGRSCGTCGTSLSRYNAGTQCSLHEGIVTTTPKPYACRQGCDREYTRPNTRNSHERRVHGVRDLSRAAAPLQQAVEVLGFNATKQRYASHFNVSVYTAAQAIIRLMSRDSLRWDAYDRWMTLFAAYGIEVQE